jgi:hemoglobin-like flavoprotein
MALTDEQRHLVTISFARLVPISSEATSAFYNRLWEIAPETKALFHSVDMTQQGMKLMQTLGIAVRALHDLNSIAPFLTDLGKRHIAYGVTTDQFDLVKAALLWMIEECLAEDFSPATHEAWTAAYDLIASITMSAYEPST